MTFTKTFYPPGSHRLLTGGVEEGEDVLDALRREVVEETGLEVVISRFLALIVYRAENDADGLARMFTFAFLLDELGGSLRAMDPSEQLAGYGETDLPGLLTLATRLEGLPDVYAPELGESWRDWGAFRAVVHRVIWQVLSDGKP